ncbi:hypothetical protein D3C81_1837900 [compost metagenome]
MSKALQPAHQHQSLQMPDMQTVSRGIEAKVGAYWIGSQGCAQLGLMRTLMNEAALLQQMK